MLGFLSKTSVVFIFVISFFFFLSSPSFAQTKTSTPPSTNVDANVPDNLHNWTQTVMIEVMSSLSCQLTGIDPTTATKQCLGVDIKTGKIGFLPSGNSEKGEVGGAIGTMGNLITMLYTPPIHTSDYFQNLAQNFGIIKTTYAQTTGTGFEGLRPFLGLWTGFRNVAYLIFVIVFIVIGLAIMLRVKIDPRTVMTIQNQIPKIIIGILLVTFSYAIAGFLVDMMYVSIHVIGNMIISADPTLDKNLPTQLSRETNTFSAAGHVGAGGGNAGTGLWSLIFSPAKAIGETITNLFDPAIDFFSSGLIGAFLPDGGTWWNPVNWFGNITSALLSPLNNAVAQLVHVMLGVIIGTLAFIIISISLLIALFKLWFMLIKAYVSILIDVVLAPFWIIGGLVPGSPINVSGWFRDLIANLAAFPATIAMFLLGKVFMTAFETGDSATRFTPPLIGNPVEGIGALIGLGIILMTPNVVNMLKTALKAPKIDTGGGAMAGLGAGFGAVKEVGGTVAAYNSKLPEAGKSEGFGGVAKRIFR